ncbi:hypothetical protein TYRP_013328 [Tyrophagus putrescentiae]|nr:hypothetical protein TYRP_013328 [Tyrophagus putrescentiae]
MEHFKMEWALMANESLAEPHLFQKIRVIFFIALLAYIFVTCLFGLIGVIRENFCMMSVFVVSQVASAIITVAIDVFNGYWSDLFLGIGPLIVTLLGLFYLRDLYVIRQQHKMSHCKKLNSENHTFIMGDIFNL